jgi:hypothetical protein
MQQNCNLTDGTTNKQHKKNLFFEHAIPQSTVIEATTKDLHQVQETCRWQHMIYRYISIFFSQFYIRNGYNGFLID